LQECATSLSMTWLMILMDCGWMQEYERSFARVGG
jgi:hypothetical protein